VVIIDQLKIVFCASAEMKLYTPTAASGNNDNTPEGRWGGKKSEMGLRDDSAFSK
jgi:hypothetical protein